MNAPRVSPFFFAACAHQWRNVDAARFAKIPGPDAQAAHASALRMAEDYERATRNAADAIISRRESDAYALNLCALVGADFATRAHRARRDGFRVVARELENVARMHAERLITAGTINGGVL